MRFFAIFLSTFIGFSTPIVLDLLVAPQVAVAQEFPAGSFTDGEWLIDLWHSNSTFNYQGKNLYNNKTIFLSGAQQYGNYQRPIYSWNNGNYRYQIAWQPNSNRNLIRLKVIAPNGKVVLNRLLTRK